MQTLVEAMKYYGQTEVKGPASNEFILKLQNKALSKYGLTSTDDGSYPWCAIFVSFILNETGIWKDKWLIRAMDFMKEFPVVSSPEFGKTLTLLWRETPTSGKGHIGWSINEYGATTNIFGGNQSDTVNISPFNKGRVKAYLKLPE